MPKKIVVSIPIHESPLVVHNQLENIKQFVPNSNVILHVSGDSSEQFYQEILKIRKEMDGFCYVNPTRIPTYKPDEAGQVTNLTSVHISNFLYMDEFLEFDYFALETSNDMFVRKDLEKILENHYCCFSNINFCPYKDFQWKEVIDNLRLVSSISIECGLKGPPEGSLYPIECFRFAAETLRKLEIKLEKFLNMEEMYIPTIIFNAFPDLAKLNSDHFVFHDNRHLEVTKEDIHKVQYGQYGNKFAVKRVSRNENFSEIRKYINEITKE